VHSGHVGCECGPAKGEDAIGWALVGTESLFRARDETKVGKNHRTGLNTICCPRSWQGQGYFISSSLSSTLVMNATLAN
jgi:hypothetical protein